MNTKILNVVRNLEPTFQENTSTTDWIEVANHTSKMDCMQLLVTPFISSAGCNKTMST
jgi:hypothetical protein